jgi:hypothetical protein
LERTFTTLEVMEALPNIPSDIQREVLLRVPYKLHNTFKAMCGIWEAMMSTPQFFEDRRTYGKN